MKHFTGALWPSISIARVTRPGPNIPPNSKLVNIAILHMYQVDPFHATRSIACRTRSSNVALAISSRSINSITLSKSPSNTSD